MSTINQQSVRIDALADCVYRHVDHAIVCIDVFLSSTTLVTAVAQGRRTLLSATVDEGRTRANSLPRAIVMAEPGLAGGEDLGPSAGPHALEGHRDTSRPLVVCSPAADVVMNAKMAPAVYVACLRNMSATAQWLAEKHDRVALVGAGHGGDVRYEDQMVAAWIAGKLIDLGFEAEGPQTLREVQRWAGVDVSMASLSRGAEQLRRLGRFEDLEFVLSRVDDLDITCRYVAGEMRGTWAVPVRSAVGS